LHREAPIHAVLLPAGRDATQGLGLDAGQFDIHAGDRRVFPRPQVARLIRLSEEQRC
jgi:hypothetical protein